MKLTLGFSTCPNDTFIFDAMVHNKIDTEGLKFELVMGDVEELNKMAINAELDITKISYHAFAYIAQNYKILDSGSALGRNNGPLLISKKKIYPDEVPHLKVAIPGQHTTANLILRTAYPEIRCVKEYLFSDIEEVVLDNEVDAGLIIHETRFTYKKRGLKKILDLGEYWEEKTGFPVPLGGIIVNRKLSDEVQQKVNRVLRRSIDYAFENPNSALEFIRQFAQEMDEQVMYKHIELYVNDFTKDLGELGKKSIRYLLDKAVELSFVDSIPEDIFVS
ncbi:MAG: 1,4-dihydroxy-6-naphthoate synthase [Bacteroidales bacterium]|nr:1,4-dihydroxy-6-naphthoate synthase [Bacteroidales bacterium]